MDWRLKCLAFHLLARAPFGRAAYGLLQRFVTRRYFKQVTPEVLDAYGFHVQNFGRLPSGSVALEFGAGRNLLAPLLLSHTGAARVYAYDIDRLATVEQINNVIAQLRVLIPGEWPAISSLDDLSTLYRIDYHAPADARQTGLPDGSVDFIYSTSTLEHIAPDDIHAILTECKRISSSTAMMSFIIDYHDHYASFDRRITPWNFYRYSDTAWRKFNPGQHFQNRLRHCDHQNIFADLGLSAMIDKRVLFTDEPTAVCETFSHYAHEDLVAKNGLFLLRLHHSDHD